ncbi:MAG: DUF2220 domain-containing protein [Lachnospiraceae bacterium]|nr:DUF2220 domain-containing protein [Lachnospiraceae bacterium]
MTKIQQKTINRLLDKYEKSKTFLGTNQVSQSFEKRVVELFPKYADEAEYEVFCEVNEALHELEQQGLVELRALKGDVLDRVVLNVERLPDCYAYVKRIPRREEQEWFREIWNHMDSCPVLERYVEEQEKKLDKNGNVEYYSGDREEYTDLLKLVRELSLNEEEVFLRDFSIQLFKDSKRIEKLVSKAQALMYQYGDFEDKDSVLEECGVVHTPTYVCMKGNGRLFFERQQIDLSEMDGDLALSTSSLKGLQNVQVTGARVVTVENLTSFHDYNRQNDFVIYLGGFHNQTKREFLCFLHEQNRDKEYRHFGDIDVGGFYILEHLKEKTGIPFRSLSMGKDVLEAYASQTKPLTENDKKRMKQLLSKLDAMEEKGVLTEDYREVLYFMLEHNCKLEQEVCRCLV